MASKTCLGVTFSLLFLIIIAVIVVCFLAKNGERPKETVLPFWKKNIVYQVYPRSLSDQDGDGIGDLKGITSKASYLHDLGVGTVWLSPIFSSPMADFGYDIANFTAIDPLFGTIEDFDQLKNTLHGKGLKLVLDFVPNHSSDEHDWFVRSTRREEPYTDYYIWADKIGVNGTGDPIPPNNWLSVFKGSAWTWSEDRQQFYFHQFLNKQPDLNYRNPLVRQEMKDVVKFWMDRGVDGLRLDAVKFLFEVEDIQQDEPVAVNSGIDDPMDYYYLNHTLTINLPETFEVVREWRELMDKYSDRFMMAEVYDDDIHVIMKYYGNDTVPLADFPFNFLMIDNFRNRTDLSGFALKEVVDTWMDNMPEGRWPNWVLGNHDNARVASRFGEDMVDALNMMLLLLPGTPVTYYGEEIGMENTFISWEDTQDPQGCNYGPEKYQEYSRDPERTPMQWDNTSFAGFTTSNDTWLPVNENYKDLNVMMQEHEEESHLKLYKELAHLRKEKVFSEGHIAYPVITKDVFSFVRYLEGHDSYLLIINTSEDEVEVNMHHHANMELPESADVVMRSITDNSTHTHPGYEVELSDLKLVPGQGLLLKSFSKEG